MRQRTLLLAVGGLAFVAVGIATLPASIVTSRLPTGLAVEGVSGSIWNGAADGLKLRGTPLGAVSWTLAPASLLQGRLDFAIELARPDGFLKGRIAATFAGEVRAEDVTLELPITTLDPGHADNAWQGRLAGTIREARLEHGWPVSLTANFTIANLRPPGASVTIGTYAVDFDPGASTRSAIVGRVRDVESPLLVRAQLIVKPERSYSLDGDVTPRIGAPAEVTQAVAFLGSPDSSGRRQFTITGSF